VTPGRLLDAALRRDGARPLLTWYDDASGERIELSVATAANWAAKTANFLVDDHGLDDGDSIGLSPTSHWLSVVVLLGAWTAGVGVDVTGEARDLVLPGDPAGFMRAVLAQPDALLVAPATDASIGIVCAARSWTLAELLAAAAEPGPHSRILSTHSLDTAQAVVDAVITPLACDGSAVLVTNADPDKLASHAQTERVTHTAGIDVAGLPRLHR
jgi:hypothetical protein